MNMRRGARRSSRGRGPAPRYAWDSIIFGEATLAPGNLVGLEINPLPPAGDELERQTTIERCIGHLWIRASGTSGFDALGACGLIVMEEDAFVAAALPDPLSQGDASWLWYTHWADINLNSSQREGYAQRYDFDVHSRRHFGHGTERFVAIVECSILSTGNVAFMFGVRTLLRTT